MSAWRRTVLAAPKITALGLLVALLGVWSTAQGQPPRSADLETVRGKVDRFTTAPKGEVDGLILDDGTWVHWPPHLENRFKDIAARGDRVRVTGWTETGPKGDTKFETQTLVNQRTNASADRGDDAPPPRERRIGKGPAVAGNVETRRGMVRSFTSAPKGEVDGLVLDDGTWVHWPPHMQDRFTD